MNNLKTRFAVMNFLQFAVWGSYLTSMGTYLFSIGMEGHIGMFYAMQGIVSLFMPALMGIVADRWVPAQKLLSFCHIIAALFMAAAGYYGMTTYSIDGQCATDFATLFTLYSCSVAFYMPTLALSNSVAYSGLERAHMDTVKVFPPIRTLGTIGFILMMWFVDLMGFQDNYNQFFAGSGVGLLFGVYALTLPACPVSRAMKGGSFVEALGLNAFKLFKQKKLAIFFLFSMLLGVSLQITNGFANSFITGFGTMTEYADTFGVKHANILISISQISETLCILLIPFVMKKFGIKRVMAIAMFAWVFRFGLFGLGNPGSGVWMFILSMIVYGVAFDFFNVSGSLYVNQEVDERMRSSAQGLFVLMTNGFGATIGTLSAQAVIDKYVFAENVTDTVAGWQTSWFIFAAYALVVGLAFLIVFKDGKVKTEKLVR